MNRRLLGLPIAAVICAIGCVVGLLLPWVYSGSIGRSSFQLFGLIDRLGFTPGGILGAIVKWWPVAPLVLTTAVVMIWAGRVRSGAIIGLCASIAVGAFAAVMRFGAAKVPTVRLGDGPVVSLVCAIALGATCVLSLVRGARLPRVPAAERPLAAPQGDPS